MLGFKNWKIGWKLLLEINDIFNIIVMFVIINFLFFLISAYKNILIGILDIYILHIIAQMRITYGFIFYLTIATITLTILLALLYFKKIRNLTFNILNKLKIGSFPVSKMIVCICLCIIGIVMFDAIASYMNAKNTLGSNYSRYEQILQD